jgi:hypothetical protein
MRCVVVNGAKLKADALCAHCGNKVGMNYVREISTRLIYCDFHCYGVAVEPSIRALGYRLPITNAGTRSA